MMKTGKKATKTIGIMIFVAIIILVFYYYISNRTDPIQDTSTDNLSETEKILNEDLQLYYPETSKEVVKFFARIMKALYNNPKDDEVKPLALKIRELYDEEFLKNNPEDTYLTNLYTDIAAWKDKDRKITNYLLVKEDDEEDKKIDGVKYSTKFVSFTIQQNIKFSETWKVLLRQDENKQWKILGWEYVPEEEDEE
jgi:hypothetical protein